MAVYKPLLKVRSLLLAKLESSYNVDSVPTAASDALLVADAVYTPNTTPLERNIQRGTISDSPIATGRTSASLNFVHELRGGGSAAAAPKLGRLFRACGMSESQITSGASNQIGNLVAAGANTGPTITFGKTGAPTGYYGLYRITCVLGGASATAKVRVSQYWGSQRDPLVLPNEEFTVQIKQRSGSTLACTVNSSNPLSVTYAFTGSSVAGDEVIISVGGVIFSRQSSGVETASTIATAVAALIDADTLIAASASSGTVTVTFAGAAAGVAITSGATSITFGSSTATATFTWSGNLVMGDTYYVYIYPVGFNYVPRDDVENAESITMYSYLDGVLRVLTGARGSFTITAESGQYPRIEFRFQGQYNEPRNEALPTAPAYESTLPLQVENMNLNVDGNWNLISQSASYDIGNTINLRESISGSDGYDGALLVDRSETGTITPEITKESDFGFMNRLSSSKIMPVSWVLGLNEAAGQRILFGSNAVQFSQNQEGDRSGVAIYTTSLRIAKPLVADLPDVNLVFF